MSSASPTGSILTPQGTAIAHWAIWVLADVDHRIDVAEGLRVERSVELVVGASMAVAEDLMPAWLWGGTEGGTRT